MINLRSTRKRVALVLGVVLLSLACSLSVPGDEAGDMAQEGDVQEADEQPATATEEVCDYPQTDISDNSYDNPLPPGQVYNFGPFTFSIEEVERPADDAIQAYADMMAERGEVVETDPGDGLEWLKFVIQTHCGTSTPIWNVIDVEGDWESSTYNLVSGEPVLFARYTQFFLVEQETDVIVLGITDSPPTVWIELP